MAWHAGHCATGAATTATAATTAATTAAAKKLHCSTPPLLLIQCMSNCCFTAPLPQFMDLCSTAAIPSTHAPLLHCSTAAAAHVQDRKYALPEVGMHFHQLLLKCCHVLWGGLLQVLQQGATSELCAATALPCPALHLCCIAAPRSVHSICAAAQVMVHIHLCRMHTSTSTSTFALINYFGTCITMLLHSICAAA